MTAAVFIPMACKILYRAEDTMNSYVGCLGSARSNRIKKMKQEKTDSSFSVPGAGTELCELPAPPLRLLYPEPVCFTNHFLLTWI